MLAWQMQRVTLSVRHQGDRVILPGLKDFLPKAAQASEPQQSWQEVRSIMAAQREAMAKGETSGSRRQRGRQRTERTKRGH